MGCVLLWLDKTHEFMCASLFIYKVTSFEVIEYHKLRTNIHLRILVYKVEKSVLDSQCLHDISYGYSKLYHCILDDEKTIWYQVFENTVCLKIKLQLKIKCFSFMMELELLCLCCHGNPSKETNELCMFRYSKKEEADKCNKALQRLKYNWTWGQVQSINKKMSFIRLQL